MSFGTDPGPAAPRQAVRDAIDYAYAARRRHGRRRRRRPGDRAGRPGQRPAADGHRRRTSTAGMGLSVTAVDASDARASFAGRGSQISLAAYGALRAQRAAGRAGCFGAFPAQHRPSSRRRRPRCRRRPPCNCRTTFDGDARYAYAAGHVDGDAAGRGASPRWCATSTRTCRPPTSSACSSRPPAAPAGGAGPASVGWGILDAGAALAAAREHRPHAPTSRSSAWRPHGRARIVVRWRGGRPRPAGVRASGVARYELWRAIDGGRQARCTRPRARRARVALRARRALPLLHACAIDRAGNREPAPSRPTPLRPRASASAGPPSRGVARCLRRAPAPAARRATPGCPSAMRRCRAARRSRRAARS